MSPVEHGNDLRAAAQLASKPILKAKNVGFTAFDRKRPTSQEVGLFEKHSEQARF